MLGGIALARTASPVADADSPAVRHLVIKIWLAKPGKMWQPLRAGEPGGYDGWRRQRLRQKRTRGRTGQRRESSAGPAAIEAVAAETRASSSSFLALFDVGCSGSGGRGKRARGEWRAATATSAADATKGKTSAEERAADGEDDGDGHDEREIARKKAARLPAPILPEAAQQRMFRHGVTTLVQLGSFCKDLHMPYECQHHHESALFICYGIFDDDHDKGMAKLNVLKPSPSTLKVSVEVVGKVLEALARTLLAMLMRSDPLGMMSDRYRKRQEQRKLYFDDDDAVRGAKLKSIVQQARLLQKRIAPESESTLERTIHIGKQHAAFSRMRRHSAAKIGQWAMKKVRKNRERKRLLEAEMPAYMRRQRAALAEKKKKKN